ncbi:MAG: FAD:protein FMN transferase [Chitinophagales bacterium]|nr:FAD:protein FMN transferase [Chitinophagales bacterium]
MRYLTFLLLLSLASACQKPAEFVKITGDTMGTTYIIKYEGKKNFQLQIDSLLEVINNSMSTYIKSSLISQLNYAEAGNFITVEPHFAKVYRQSVKICTATGGAFDPSIMPVLEFWGFGGSQKKVSEVDSAVIDSLKMLIGMDKFSIQNAKNGIIISKSTDARLDFSAVAKGYAVDVLSQFLMNKGIENFMVEIGGELRGHGFNDRGEHWVIGINKPVENAAERDIKDIFRVENMAVATSGNYRNYKEINGQKVGHTFNPKTGYPQRSNLLSATIFAKTCLKADAYATACMVLGLEKSLQLIEASDSIEASFIYIDSSSELKTMLTEGAKSYQLKN